MKILFNGLGPKDTVNYEGKTYRNGSTVDMPDEFAAAYLDAKLAVVEQPGEAQALQELEVKNEESRRRVREKAEKKEDA